jgi:hypothetical protein
MESAGSKAGLSRRGLETLDKVLMIVLAKIDPQERPMLAEGSQAFDSVRGPAAVKHV